MRNLIYLIFGLILLGCAQEKTKDPIHKVFLAKQKRDKGNYKLIDRVFFKIDNDDVLDTINIFNIPNWTDPGDFQKLEIKTSNHDLYEFYNLGDWINMNSNQIKEFKSVNRVNTNRFLITDLSDKKTIMIIFGYRYASTPGNLTVIDLSKGKPDILFNDSFELDRIKDINDDNLKELIGCEFYSEGCCYNDSISFGHSYSPYFVLKCLKDTCIADKKLSENYNYKNYVGFFGLDYDMDMRYLIIVPKKGQDFDPYFYFEKYRKYPETSLKYLEEEDLSDYSKKELRLMRNEIFAFHGYKFNSKDLKEYFSNQDWYKPSDRNINERLNKFERANIKLIQKLEKK